MWIIAGTVPEPDFGLYTESIWMDSKVEGDRLVLPDGNSLPVARGTTALAATAIVASNALGEMPPRLVLAGDCGTGKGSLALYRWLSDNIGAIAAKTSVSGLTFHYFYPDLDGHNRLLLALRSLSPKPVLVADAGFMYVAKMSGFAREYDLFTPDAGELAFLADEKAPHPFYTRGFLLSKDNGSLDLISRCMEQDNCPPNMIVKGSVDLVLCEGEKILKVAEPAVSAMECIGGTGDIVTGFATAFLNSGKPVCQSAILAARTSRYLAAFCNPTPATQAATLIANIDPMFERFQNVIGKID